MCVLALTLRSNLTLMEAHRPTQHSVLIEKWQKMTYLQQNDRRQKKTYLQTFWELL